MKHTKGPWDYDYYGDHAAFAGSDNRDDYTFRVEFTSKVSDKEKIAVVDLISAAPEMYVALKKIDQHLDKTGIPGGLLDQLLEARAALAKAEGRK